MRQTKIHIVIAIIIGLTFGLNANAQELNFYELNTGDLGIEAACFISRDTGWVLADSTYPLLCLKYTCDAGKTWNTVKSFNNGYYYKPVISHVKRKNKPDILYVKVAYWDNLYYKIGDLNEGTWQTNAKISSLITDIKVISENVSYVYYNGYNSIIKIDNNTQDTADIKIIYGEKNVDILDVTGINDNIAFARVGINTTGSNYSYDTVTIIKTTDGWNSWKFLSLPEDKNYIQSFDFISENEGYAIIRSWDRYGNDYTVYKTSDGGNSWSSTGLSSGYYVSDLKMFPNKAGYIYNVSSYYSYYGSAKSLKDNASSWTEKLKIERLGYKNGSFYNVYTKTKFTNTNIVIWNYNKLYYVDAMPANPANVISNYRSASRVDISWSDNAKTETYYVIERSINNDSTFISLDTLSANTTSYVDSSMSDADVTKYYYRVKAVAWDDIASYSVTSTYPLSVKNLVFNRISANKLELSWKNPAGIGSKHEIERAEGNSSSFKKVGEVKFTDTLFVDANSNRDKSYTYRVKTVNYSNDAFNIRYHKPDYEWVDRPRPDYNLRTTLYFYDPPKNASKIDLQHVGSYKVNYDYITYKSNISSSIGHYFYINNPPITYGYRLKIYNAKEQGYAYSQEISTLGNWQEDMSWSKDFSAVCYTDYFNLWVAGTQGTILHTADGGANWNVQNSTANRQIFDIFFFDEDYGWAVCDQGILLKTIDGGNTWQQSVITPSKLAAVYFESKDYGWVAGNAGNIWYTSNSGTSWSQATAPGNYYNDLFFISQSKGWAVGSDGIILSSTDGGHNWTTRKSSGEELNSVYFINENTGFACGDNGALFQTTDGGINWTEKSSGTPFNLNEVTFSDTLNGWISGDYQTILYTYNAGENWYTLASDEYMQDSIHYNGIAVQNTGTGWLVGGNGTDGVIYKNVPAEAPLSPSLKTGIAVSETSVNIAWDKSISDNAGYFKIERAPVSTGIFTEIDTIITSDANFTDVSLTAGTEYLYRIKAYNAKGVSGYSNELQVNTLCYPLAAPDSIFGRQNACVGGHDTLVYSINSISGALEYIWTLPEGIEAIGNNSTADTFITVSVSPYFISGYLKAQAFDDCIGMGDADSILIQMGDSVVITVADTIHESQYGMADGAFSVKASAGYGAPYSFRISDTLNYEAGITADSAVLDGLSRGSYEIFVKDSEGCETSAIASISLGKPIYVYLTETQPEPCVESSAQNGSVNIEVSGGMGNYYASIDSGVTYFPLVDSDTLIENLTFPTYYVFVKDAYNNYASDSVNFYFRDSISINYDIVHSLCTGYPMGTINVSVSGGSGNYVVSFSGDESSEYYNITSNDTVVIDSIPGGTYFVEAYDAVIGCASDRETIDMGGMDVTIRSPLYGASEWGILCWGTYESSFKALVRGGSPPYEYSTDWGGAWNAITDSTFTETFPALGDTIFPLWVRDNAGCEWWKETSQNLEIAKYNIAGEVIEQQDPECYMYGGKLVIGAVGGVPPYRYRIDEYYPSGDSTIEGVIFSGGASVTIEPAYADRWYVVHIMDTVGCMTNYGNFTRNGLNTYNVNDPATLTNFYYAVGFDECNYPETAEAIHFEGLRNSVSGGFEMSVDGGKTFTTDQTFYLNENTTYKLVAKETATGCLTQAEDFSSEGLKRLDVTLINKSDVLQCGGEDATTGSVTLKVYDHYTNEDVTSFLTINVNSTYFVELVDYEGVLYSPATISNGVITGIESGTYGLRVLSNKGGGYNWCRQKTFKIKIKTKTTAFDPEINIIHESCTGNNDGKITVTGKGGFSPYTYSFDYGAYGTSNVYDSLSAGTYNVSIMDSIGCETNEFVDIKASGIKDIIAGNVKCTGGNGTLSGNVLNKASIQFLLDGNNSFYSYSIDNGNNFYSAGHSKDTIILHDFDNGYYDFLLRSAEGCIVEVDDVYVSSDFPDISSEVTICDKKDGAISLLLRNDYFKDFIINSDNDYSDTITYNFSGPFEEVLRIEGLEKGYTYTLESTASNGCYLNEQITLNFNDTLKLDVVTTPPDCNLGTGSILVTPNEEVTGLYYYRDLSASTPQDSVYVTQSMEYAEINGLDTGRYEIIVEAYGEKDYCLLRSEVELLAPPADFSVLCHMKPVTCKGNNDGQITVSVNGMNSDAYLYSIDNGLTYTPGLPDIPYFYFNNLNVGTYYIAVKDKEGCNIVRDTIEVEESLTSLSTNNLLSNDPSCSGSMGNISYSAAGGTSGEVYTSYMSGPVNLQRSDSSEFFFDQLPAGTYYITTIDSFECEVQDTVTIKNPSELDITAEVTDASCYKSGDGSIIVHALGGTTPYSYSIDGSAYVADSVFINLMDSSYTVNVRDSALCETMFTPVIVNANPNALYAYVSEIVSITDSIETGSVTIVMQEGIPVYTYIVNSVDTGYFSADTLLIDSLAQGNYTIEIIDQTGCSSILENILISKPDLNISIIDKQNVSCYGKTDGAFTIQATGEVGDTTFAYSINNGVSYNVNGVFETLAPDFYTVFIKVNDVLRDTFQVSITEPAPLTIDWSKTEPLCYGSSNGKIYVNIGGNGETFTYVVNTDTVNVTDSTIANLYAGAYDVKVINENQCSVEANGITLSQPDSLKLSTTSISNILCYSSDSGSVTLSATGGTLPYTYYIINDTISYSAFINSLKAGIYNFKVEDKNNCSDTLDQQVEIALSTFSAAISDIINPQCYGDAGGSFTVNTNDSTMAYYLSINDQPYMQFNNPLDSLIAGNYQVFIKDSLGCVDTLGTATINMPDKLTVEILATNGPGCFGESTGNITPVVYGGTTPYSYYLKDSVLVFLDSGRITGLSSGMYNLKILDSNYCETEKKNIFIGDYDAIDVQARFLVPDTIEVGDTMRLIELIVPQPDSSFWYFGNGLFIANKDTAIIYDTIGDHTVQLAGYYGGCSKARTKAIYVTEAKKQSGLELPGPDFTAVKELSVYPNPSPNGFTYFIHLSRRDNIIVSIESLTGVTLNTTKAEGVEIFTRYFDLSALPKGMYIINTKVGKYFTEPRVLVKGK